MTLDTVRAEYDTGKSFVSESRDVFGRPVLIITASKHNIGERWAGNRDGHVTCQELHCCCMRSLVNFPFKLCQRPQHVLYSSGDQPSL